MLEFDTKWVMVEVSAFYEDIWCNFDPKPVERALYMSTVHLPVLFDFMCPTEFWCFSLKRVFIEKTRF